MPLNWPSISGAAWKLLQISVELFLDDMHNFPGWLEPHLNHWRCFWGAPSWFIAWLRDLVTNNERNEVLEKYILFFEISDICLLSLASEILIDKNLRSAFCLLHITWSSHHSCQFYIWKHNFIPLGNTSGLFMFKNPYFINYLKKLW